MIRTVVRLTPTFIFPIIEKRNENDNNMLQQQRSNVPGAGFDRLKKMYKLDEFGEVSVELHNVMQSSMCGAFIGACLGGFVKSREAYLYFIENNQATIFKSTMQAKRCVYVGVRGVSMQIMLDSASLLSFDSVCFCFAFAAVYQNKRLQDYVTVAFAQGAYHWGWRLGIFTGIFSLIATTVSVYRGDTSLVEYVAAGTIAGAMYKANLGLAAMMVGAGLGGALSMFGGLLILGILKVTGATMDDIRRAFYKLKEAREDQFNQALEKSATIKNDSLTKHHDMIVQEKGENAVEEL